MRAINPQYIKDAEGNKSWVVLSLVEFESILEELEKLEDVFLYDEAKKKKQTFMSAETAFAQIEAKRSVN